MRYSLLVKLDRKELYVTDENREPVKRFPVIFGRNSHLGTKTGEGDQRTPRGKYYVCTINEKSKYTLFFGISYPGYEDASRGLREGYISSGDFERIVSSLESGLRPPWDTPLGGEIGIHGGGIDRDGTRGCIGMRDDDVLSLSPYVVMGTEVLIEWGVDDVGSGDVL
jgi:murein L,D-transpeptidase YafK